MLFKKFFTLTALFIICASTAQASFHRWVFNELYSNADGSIQFIELREDKGDDDQHLLATDPDPAQLSSTDGIITNLMASFPNDLPSNLTANKFFLIGTAGYAAALGAVAPDYTLPDGFLFTGGGTVDFGLGVDELIYGALPTGGILSLNADGTTGINSPTNFAGEIGSVAPAAVPVPAAVWLFGSGLLALISIGRRRVG